MYTITDRQHNIHNRVNFFFACMNSPKKQPVMRWNHWSPTVILLSIDKQSTSIRFIQIHFRQLLLHYLLGSLFTPARSRQKKITWSMTYLQIFLHVIFIIIAIYLQKNKLVFPHLRSLKCGSVCIAIVYVVNGNTSGVSIFNKMYGKKRT